jgi:hypothetical protein
MVKGTEAILRYTGVRRSCRASVFTIDVEVELTCTYGRSIGLLRVTGLRLVGFALPFCCVYAVRGDLNGLL